MFKAFYDLVRFDHAILIAVGIVVGEILALGSLPGLRMLLLSIATGMFIEMGAFALNDYLDYKTDKKNNRQDRPLIRGDISLNSAFYFSLIALPLGVLCSALIDSNIVAVWIAAAFALLSILYDFYLKKVALLGNASIAASMAIPFIFGSVAVSQGVSAAVWVLALIAFFTGLGREIIKSIQDLEGDKSTGRKTLPVVIGEIKSARIASAFLLVAITISFVPFFIAGKFAGNVAYLLPILLTDALLLLSIKHVLKVQELEAVRAITLLAQGTGLLGFLLGAFVQVPL